MSDINDNFFSKFPNWLRWLFLPIVVILSYVISTALIGILLWITRGYIGASDNSWMGWAHYYVVQPGVACYATVMASAYCAPSNSFTISLIIGGLFAILNGMGIMSMTALGFDLGMLTALVFGTIGAGIAIYQIKDETT